jgi:hypothetical protein
MDGVILAVGMVASLVAIVGLIFGAEGSKGITDEYTSKSGVKRTAKKDRQEHIV